MFFIVFYLGFYRDRFAARIYFVLYTFLSSVPLFFFIVYINFIGITNFIFTNPFIRNFFSFFIILGFLVKIPVYPFHLWLVKTHLEAPVYGSIILAGILIKIGVYGLYRLHFFLFSISHIVDFFCFISLLGSLLICFYCFRLHDIKLVIASSSIVHICIFIFGFFHFGFCRLIFCLVFIIRHGFCSSGLFFIVGTIYLVRGSRRFLISKRLFFFNPFLCFLIFIFILLNIRFPPRMNFFSEVNIILLGIRFSYFLIPFFFYFVF